MAFIFMREIKLHDGLFKIEDKISFTFLKIHAILKLKFLTYFRIPDSQKTFCISGFQLQFSCLMLARRGIIIHSKPSLHADDSKNT